MVARPAWHCTRASGQEGPVGTAVAVAAAVGVRSCGDGEEEGKGEKSERGAEEKAARLSRRQKETGGDMEGNADLLTIPGVGPKNLRKLVEKGFTGMAELKQFYKDKVFFFELLVLVLLCKNVVVSKLFFFFWGGVQFVVWLLCLKWWFGGF